MWHSPGASQASILNKLPSDILESIDSSAVSHYAYHQLTFMFLKDHPGCTLSALRVSNRIHTSQNLVEDRFDYTTPQRGDFGYPMQTDGPPRPYRQSPIMPVFQDAMLDEDLELNVENFEGWTLQGRGHVMHKQGRRTISYEKDHCRSIVDATLSKMTRGYETFRHEQDISGVFIVQVAFADALAENKYHPLRNTSKPMRQILRRPNPP